MNYKKKKNHEIKKRLLFKKKLQFYEISKVVGLNFKKLKFDSEI